jgi:hypothetical protein
MASITSFLVQMTNDPSLLERFRQDKDATMRAAGLSDEDREILHSGDSDRLRAAIDTGEDEVLELDFTAFFA